MNFFIAGHVTSTWIGFIIKIITRCLPAYPTIVHTSLRSHNYVKPTKLSFILEAERRGVQLITMY